MEWNKFIIYLRKQYVDTMQLRTEAVIKAKEEHTAS